CLTSSWTPFSMPWPSAAYSPVMGACTPILMGPSAANAVPAPVASRIAAVRVESLVSLLMSGFSFVTDPIAVMGSGRACAMRSVSFRGLPLSLWKEDRFLMRLRHVDDGAVRGLVNPIVQVEPRRQGKSAT